MVKFKWKIQVTKSGNVKGRFTFNEITALRLNVFNFVLLWSQNNKLHYFIKTEVHMSL